jgi:hypothetical protein
MKSRGAAPLFLSRESWEQLRRAILGLEERGTRVSLTFALEDPEVGLRYVDMEGLLALASDEAEAAQGAPVKVSGQRPPIGALIFALPALAVALLANHLEGSCAVRS